MDAAAGLTVVNTNVFVIDLRYKRDRNFSVNRTFLQRFTRNHTGVTTLFNLLEVCGILSFNLNESQLRELFFYFPQRYQVQVFPAVDLDGFLPSLATEDLWHFVVQKASFGDALIMAAVGKYIPGAVRFVSWNAEHFRGKLNIPVLTPKEYVKAQR